MVLLCARSSVEHQINGFRLLGGNKNTVLATLIYQKTMTLGDWQGAAVVATIMIVVTLIVIKGINFLASRLDKRGVS